METTFFNGSRTRWTYNNVEKFAIDVSTDSILRIGSGSPTSAQVNVTQPTADKEILRLETQKTGDDPNYYIIQNAVNTTDATVTTASTIAITASKTYVIETRCTARRTGGAGGAAEDAAGYIFRGTYKTVAGTVTLVGALNADYTAEDQAAWACTQVINGTNVEVRVTGAANNNVTWHVTSTVSDGGA